MAEPRLTDTAFRTSDGIELPLRVWLPSPPVKAVLIALHGYNDYSNFIADAAVWFNGKGVGVYAYDQRGFGGAPQPGRWFGHETMGEDLRAIISLVHDRHPGVPLYLLGDSMGGAVVLTADRPDDPLPVEGVVLVAPAVWSRKTMPFYQRWVLWLAARTCPWMRVSAKGLGITPSDNEIMLEALGRDPLVIKESRIDAIYGLANLMDAAYESAASFDGNVLILYGARDEIIPPGPMADVFRMRLRGRFSNPQRLLVYQNGYHMLLRDMQEKVVWNDIFSWLTSPSRKFPSVRDEAAREISREEDVSVILSHGSGKGRLMSQAGKGM